MFSKIILVIYSYTVHTHTTVFQVLSTLQGKNKVREGESLEMEEAGSLLNREPQVSDWRRDPYSTGSLRSVIGGGILTQQQASSQWLEAGSLLNRKPQISNWRRDPYSTASLRSVIGGGILTQQETSGQWLENALNTILAIKKRFSNTVSIWLSIPELA